jgi:hypothetical protein
MSPLLWYASLAVVAALLALFLWRAAVALKWYRRFRSPAVVTCPETKHPAGVEVDAVHAALTAAEGRLELRLAECSRWAERGPCGQPCLEQIAQAPEECLVRAVAQKWYQGKPCVVCGAEITELSRMQHFPGLRDAKGRTVGWNEVPAENLPEVLQSFLPVCWKCHTIATFRREYPELVLDRPDYGAVEKAKQASGD